MKDIPKSVHLIQKKRHRRKRFAFVSVLTIFLIVIIIIFLGRLSSNSQLVLSKIKINGLKIIEQEEIELIIKENLEGKYLYLFDKSNFLIYPRQHIYNDLLIKIPRIKNLSVYRKGFDTLQIDIEEREGSYLYCGPSIPLNELEIGENCYFINNDGFIFDQAPYFSGDIYFKYFLELDNDGSYLGVQMMEPNRFQRLTRFIENIRSLNFIPVYLFLEKDGLVSLYLKKTGSNYPKIIFKEDDDIKILFENLKLAVEQKEFIDEINEKYDNLQYIDLRFENKVLYKFN